MNFLKTLFGSVNRRYLVRAYVISAALLAYALWYFASQAGLQGHQKAIMFAYAILSAVLFPFAKLVWDELRDMLLGNNTIVHFGWWAIGVNYMMKIFVNLLLWFFALGIAPLGILYLWFTNRGTGQHIDQP